MFVYKTEAGPEVVGLGSGTRGLLGGSQLASVPTVSGTEDVVGRTWLLPAVFSAVWPTSRQILGDRVLGGNAVNSRRHGPSWWSSNMSPDAFIKGIVCGRAFQTQSCSVGPEGDYDRGSEVPRQ